MDVREFVVSSITRVREATLNMVEGLSQEDLLWRAASFANPVGFLLFHTFRVEDRYYHRWLSTAEEVCEQEGWSRRWKMPDPHADAPELWYSQTGNSWTPDQGAAWEPPPKDELLEYGQRVRESAIQVLTEFDVSKLTLAPRSDRPSFTYAYYLYQLSHHEAQHQGQIDYVVGLMRGHMGG